MPELLYSLFLSHTIFQEIKTILVKYQQESLSSLFNLAYSRVEIAAAAKQQPMKLYT